MELATILVTERKKKGETQQKVADALYISRQSLSNWENGKNFPDIPMLIALSIYYDFSLDMIKGDEQFMKQVKKDYELINTKKANKKYAVLLIILLVLILLITVVVMPLVMHNAMLFKYITVITLLLCIIILHVSIGFTKIAYQQYDGMPDSPFWVPRTFGIGVSINPYNKVGKIVTISLLVIFDLFFIGMSIAILFFGLPASSIVHY